MMLRASILAVFLCTSCATTHFQQGVTNGPTHMESAPSHEPGQLLSVGLRMEQSGNNRASDNSQMRKNLLAMEAELGACMDLLYSRCATQVARLQAENALLRQRLAVRMMLQPVLIPPAY